MRKITLDYWQKRIFFLCWGAYTLAYLGRINLSVAIPLMEKSISIDKGSLGFIGSLFFWVYAFGQLINGKLGDKFASRTFVFIGLFISALMNILFSIFQSFLLMAVLWAFNGYFQSMLWGPIIKTLNKWFPEKQRSKVALYIFSSVVAGFLLTWGGLGQISSYTGWRGVFLIPGIVLLIYSVIWYLFARNSPEEAGLYLQKAELDQIETSSGFDRTNSDTSIKDNIAMENEQARQLSFWKLIFSSKLYLAALCGIPLGFVREGISLWGPTMLFETFQLNLKSTMSAVLLIPAFNFFGVIAARLFITRFTHKETKLVTVFFSGGILTCALLYIFKGSGIIVYLILLALCSLSLYGATSILTSIIPLKYKLTSSVAGFLDFSIYLGAGLSGIITGFLSKKVGWNIVVLLWVAAGIIGVICIYMAGRKRRSI